MKKTTNQIAQELLSVISNTEHKWKTSVQESLGSLFTKDDVLNIIKGLVGEINSDIEYNLDAPEVEIETKQQDNMLERVKELITLELKQSANEINWCDFLEVSDETFQIDYGNTISFDTYEIDLHSPKGLIEELTGNLFEKLEEEFKQEETDETNCSND